MTNSAHIVSSEIRRSVLNVKIWYNCDSKRDIAEVKIKQWFARNMFNCPLKIKKITKLNTT